MILDEGDSLTGNTLTMASAVSNAVDLIHAGVEEAIALANAVPARVLTPEAPEGMAVAAWMPT